MDWSYFFCFFIAAGTGIVELVARYKDEPWRAIRTSPAFVYLVINGLAACAALYAVIHFGEVEAIWGDLATSERTKYVIGAALGAMAIFRTSLMNIRVADTDIQLGPSMFLEILRGAADRAVDRAMAVPRSQKVSTIMAAVAFAKAKVVLPTYCFALMQNVTAAEQQQFGMLVDSLDAAEMSESVKSLNLGLALLNLVGERVLTTAVENLGAELCLEPEA
jgi:hypothetical protein